MLVLVLVIGELFPRRRERFGIARQKGRRIHSRLVKAAIVGALIALGSVMSSPALAKDLTPAETFEELKKLVGEWKGTTAEGGAEKVSYRLIAAETVLLEEWVLSSGRQALTVYHRDGDALVATHYCPRGNQPRLKLASASTEKGFFFEFVSATNLPDADAAHQHRFEIQIHGPDSFTRGETYLTTGKLTAGVVTYSRNR